MGPNDKQTCTRYLVMTICQRDANEMTANPIAVKSKRRDNRLGAERLGNLY